ncbi:MAG: hypothetical protein AB2604_18095, partial [Candidatus Thiodiazotropha taylori]
DLESAIKELYHPSTEGLPEFFKPAQLYNTGYCGSLIFHELILNPLSFHLVIIIGNRHHPINSLHYGAN